MGYTNKFSNVVYTWSKRIETISYNNLYSYLLDAYACEQESFHEIIAAIMTKKDFWTKYFDKISYFDSANKESIHSIVYNKREYELVKMHYF